MKYNTITKQVAERVPGGIYESVDYHGEPPADVAARAGWVDVTPEIQAQLDADAESAAQAQAAAVLLPQDVTLGKATIRTHPDGSIEIVRPIIMAASTNGTPAYGLLVTPEGDIVTYLDHASPRPAPEETRRRIAEAVARKATAKAKALAEINGQLQQRIENLERLLGLRQ